MLESLVRFQQTPPSFVYISDYLAIKIYVEYGVQRKYIIDEVMQQVSNQPCIMNKEM